MKNPTLHNMKKPRIGSHTIMLMITIVLFIVLYGAGCVMYANKEFGRLQNFLNVLINNAGLLIAACGITCVMLTGGIDISVGSVVAMTCMFMSVGLAEWGMSSGVLIAMILCIGLVFGAVQGYCIAYLEIQPFIVTMAGLFFARGMTAVISKEQVSVPFDSWFGQLSQIKVEMPFQIGAYLNKKGVLMVPYVRITVVVALVMVLITFLMLRYTKFGRSLYAVGGNQQSAALMGLNVKKTKLLSHVLCSFYATLGGLCFCLNTMCGTPTQATGLEMDAISSAVIGGTLLTGGVGNVIGTLFGVMINGTISSLVKFNGKLVASWANIITAILLCFFILLQAIFAKIKERKK
ncbi:MAG: sugar ABC transporter permease YjfF [Oscillospiraceae bacterium]|nr:sugar ABC transporter permease YjfF [Oscillospiraceae bacterium]